MSLLTSRIAASVYARLTPGFRRHLASLVERDFESITYRRLAAWGYRPGAIIDVGAYRGDWTRTARRIFGPIPTLMVEAQSALIPNLEAVADTHDDIVLAHAVLGAHGGEPVDFFEMGTGSSMFPENSNAPRSASKQYTQRLDDVVSQELGRIGNAFLKIDVQGAELEVLGGGGEVLRSCSLVQLELALLPYNRGAPLMPDVVDWMYRMGWLPTEISGFSRPRDRLVQIDMLFARQDSELRPSRFVF